jgi:hypothetical protein
MFIKMSGRNALPIFYSFVFSMQEHMQMEKKACYFSPPNYLEDMTIMYEKSQVLGLSACIPGQDSGTGIILNGGGEEDHIEEVQEKQVTSSPSTSKDLKRKGKTPKKTSLLKKGKNHMVRVMSRMVDDAISSNSMTSKGLSGDFTREFIRDVLTLVKEVGAI